MVLPDITMVHGRMLVCAWEVGLEEVTDTTVKLVMQTIEVKHLYQIRHKTRIINFKKSGGISYEKKKDFLPVSILL